MFYRFLHSESNFCWIVFRSFVCCFEGKPSDPANVEARALDARYFKKKKSLKKNIVEDFRLIFWNY